VVSKQQNPSPDAHPFAEETGFLLQWAHQKMRTAMNDALRPLGLNTRHLGVLALVAARGPLTQRDIIDLLDMDKSVLVYVIDELERRALAERRRAEHDRRLQAVHLTAKGREQLAAIGAATGPVAEHLLSPISPAERRQLNALLWKLILGT
jgi:DNA-binding MarR family transcriptional regulator